MYKHPIKILILIILSISSHCFAETKDLIKNTNITGYFEPLFSHANTDSSINSSNFLAAYEPYGFTIHKARVQLDGKLAELTNWELETGLDSLSFKVKDLFVNHKFHDMLEVRVGRMLVPGAYENYADSSFLSDTTNWFFDKSHSSYRWANGSFLPDNRTIGIQLHGRLLKGKLFYAFLIGNPDGFGAFTPYQNSHTYQHPNNAVAGWGRIEISPIEQISIGGFIGDGKGRRYSDSILVKLITYGANLCFSHKGFSFMYEFTRAKTGPKHKPEYAFGHVAMLSYRRGFVEPVFRYSHHIPNADKPDKLGVKEYISTLYGFNLHLSRNICTRFQYVYRTEYGEDGEDLFLNNLFVSSVFVKF